MRTKTTTCTAVASCALAFAALLPSAALAQTPSAPQAASVLQEERVGELGFRVVSLRVSDRTSSTLDSDASIALRIRNFSDKPIALNHVVATARLVDNHGYVWPGPAGRNNVIGLPIAGSRGASTDTLIDPGAELGVTFELSKQMENGQTAGESFDFQASFASYEDLGQGKVRRVRQYPVSIVGISRNAAATLPPAVQEVGDGLKKALGGLFGQ